jgi:uncharacterized ubiquitin-like protein YukD
LKSLIPYQFIPKGTPFEIIEIKMMTMFSIAVVFVVFMAVVSAMPPISVVASIKGKKFEVADVETVEEFIGKAESVGGIEAGQSSVLFRGKVLTSTDKLEDIGVAMGDVLMVVKGRKQRAVKSEVAEETGMATGLEGSMDMNSDAYKEAMKNAKPEDIQKAMKAMDNLLDSVYICTYVY